MMLASPLRTGLFRAVFLLALLLCTLHSATRAPLAFAASTSDTTTLVGDLQDELGCAGDWDPACANSQLPLDVSDGVFQAAFALPAGNFEYKVAINGTWDENYGENATLNGPNIALSLAAPESVKFYFDPATNWITSNRNHTIGVVAGDFQSELGCPGDWQPDCLRSWLQDIDNDGVYTFVTALLPAGNYEGKVAINESWDENYGAGGVLNGANIAFSVAEGAAVTFRYDATSHLLTITSQGDDDLAQIVQPPVRHPIVESNFYFVMPDRFENGDPANDSGGLAGDRLVTGFDPTDKGFYHGGDLAGLLAKMDYLEQLGVKAIWMTPMFKNRPVQGSGADVSAGYHGYWITDFTQFDPHFGTNAELEAVIEEAHSRGIKIFFDIITNHTADVIQYQEGQFSYRNKTDFPYLDASGTPFDDRDYIGSDAFPPLDAETSFPYTPVFDNAGDESVKVPAWLNNPIYYHNRGNSTFSGENSLYGDFFGLDDLFTEQPEVVEGLIDIYKFWISNHDIDGFRVDTVKHVNAEFWQEFAPAILQHAASVGKADFFIFGEVFSGNVEFLSYYTTAAEMPAVLDFYFQESVQAYISTRAPSDRLRTLFEHDDYYTDEDSNAYALPTFIGNHDRGRFGYFLDADNGGALSDDEMLARSKLAHALMYFGRGVPVVYYGDEQGFVGDGGDKDARQDMMPSQVASYNDDDLIGTDATTADANFDQSHPLYVAFQEYAALRQAHVALRSGAQIHRASSDAAGIYAMSRIDRDEKIEYVVAFNNANAAHNAAVPTYYPAGTQFDLLYAEGDAPATLTTDANGALPVDVAATSFVIYRASAAIPASAEAPGITISNLVNDQEVPLGEQVIDGNTIPDRLEIRAEVNGNHYVEVTFAVRPTGTTSYTVIGVDDNPPYRVFYDATELPAESTIDIIAVVNDLHDHLGSASVSGISVVDETAPPSAAYNYAVIHYQRSDGDYGDESSGDFNDFWGLHLWGDGIDPADVTEWTQPKPFLGEDDYGRFAWIKLQDASQDINFIVHRGDTKDGTDADRAFNPNSDSPEIWIKQDDPNFYTSRAAAQGYVTIHYQRPDVLYDGWGLHLWGDGLGDGVGTTWESPRPFDGIDDYGAFWQVPLNDVTQPVNFIIHKGDEKDPGPDQSMNPTEGSDVWIVSGDETIYQQRGAAENFVLLHYHRPAGDYGDYSSNSFLDFWGLHTWQGAEDPGWTTPRKPEAQDKFGVVFKVPLFEDATELAYILHRGDEKDPGPDQLLNLSTDGYEVWQLQGADPEQPYVLPIKRGAVGGGDLSKYQAHWLTQEIIAWDVEVSPALRYTLHYAADGSITLADGAISGGTEIALTPIGALPPELQTKWPHLAGFTAFQLEATDPGVVEDALKSQLAISARNDADLVQDATGLQIPGVLDDLYTYSGDLGVIYAGAAPTLRLWAPTARSVKLHLFDNATDANASQVIDMLPGEAGTWSASGDATWTGKYYLYEVEVFVHSTGQVEHNLVTDPYSIALATNSTRSLIVDLIDPALKPPGWDAQAKPLLAAPEDITLYELHVRDFSINDPTVPTGDRGTYNAFTHADANGMQHLQALAAAGLTHLHLLPVFDCATINEDATQRVEPDVPDAAPDSPAQQAAVMATADQDAFNWCYDPFHYGAPEGSYSTNPEGVTRIVEFRAMVQALHAAGLRVVMDVVYNHTSASGQADKSVLDKVVPGYYHRLNLDGAVETSTCCQNTATEHAMMEKLMLDTLHIWAVQYGVDGFRFDLMGHHLKQNMLTVREMLDTIDPTLYVYGEGWDFGEVVNNTRGVNATQLNMAGTGIGTFNDRLRDAVRGGGPFDEGENLVTNQGFSNGLWYDPNANNDSSEDEKAKLLLYGDQIRVGLAGNLADYALIDRNGNLVTGAQVDYNGSPAGYTQDPQEHIVYVEAHDNQTLYDNNAYKLPLETAMADRVRAQNIGLDFDLLAQGVPFIHAGSELLRSKSFDRNSYNSGDWFNRLDWSYQQNNFGVGLPPEGENGGNWDLIAPRLADPALHPDAAAIQASNLHVQEMLTIRKSSPLFRLQSEEEVMARLHFHNSGPAQIPGLIVMSLSDEVAERADLDPHAEQIIVLFNASDTAQNFTLAEWVGRELHLHPVQSASADLIVQEATFDPATGTFAVPPRTTAVFVQSEQSTITILLDVQPDSGQNFLFRGDLGAFLLDDATPQDRDPFSHARTFQVESGVYTVRQQVPGTYHLTEITCDPAASSVVDLAKGEVTISLNGGGHVTCTFTNQRKSLVRGVKYRDDNANGRRNFGERTLSGWRMTLYDSQGTPVPGLQNQTNLFGKISFFGLRAGNYAICEEVSEGWSNTQPGILDPTFQQPCYRLTVGPGQILRVLFGNINRAQAGVTQSDDVQSDDAQAVWVTDAADSEVGEENYAVEETDAAWLDTPLQIDGLFLPMITGEK